MKKIRAVAIVPTLFTLANLVCGFYAIVVVSRVERPTSVDTPTASVIESASPVKLRGLDKQDPVHNVMLSGWLIFLAMLFDAVDGSVARLSRSTSDFGGQLDSLCDLVSFGAAPAFLLVKMCPGFTYRHNEIVWLIAASYCACAALRLARFNVETDEDDDHLHFAGLPSPAAAAVIAGFAIFFYSLRREDNMTAYAPQIDAILQTALPIFAVIVALLMVSRIPYPHAINQFVRGQRSFAHLVSLVFVLVAVAVIREYALVVGAVAFVLIGPVRYAWQTFVQRRPQQDPLF